VNLVFASCLGVEYLFCSLATLCLWNTKDDQTWSQTRFDPVRY